MGDAIGERSAAQQPEDKEGRTGLTPKVVERNHVRMLEPRHQLGFGLEPLHEPRVVGELSADRLHRHLAPDGRLHGAVHGTERAFADQLTQLVAGDRHRGRGRQ